MVQPQAQAGSALKWEMAGGEGIGVGSQGSLRVPPDLADSEAVNRLLGDNHQLREALRRSNVALKERCEEMEEWQQRSRKEREFLSCRFQEARALVERLSEENHALLAKLNHTGAHTNGRSMRKEQNSIGTQINDLPLALDMSKNKGETELKDLENATDRQTPPSSLPIDGANEFLKLLKSHKEKLEENLQEFRIKNKELERKREEVEEERDCLRNANAQLQLELSQIQGGGVLKDMLQRSDSQASNSESAHLASLVEELQIAQARYKELVEKYDSLQKSTAQRDKSEARLKQKDKDFGQMTKDSEALKSQVTSLLGELQERQTCLENSEKERERLQERLSTKTEALQFAERELEQLKKQHSVTVDQLRLQTENLETALKTERHFLTEEKRKLAQLQRAYTQLFQDYDTKLKNESQVKQRGGEVEDLACRLEEAERALALKQDLIDKLKEEVEQQRTSLETIPVLTAQAEIFKADFLAEREAREKLNQRKEELQEQLNKTLAELDRMKQEGTSRARMEVMQQRHLEDFQSGRPPQAGMFAGATVPFSPSSFRRQSMSEELPDFRCPKCQYQAPEMDTLQIHVMDCIQ
ncbi:NF-kappa-B essential modulator isoform X2 [Scleropages formosus]|uniref:NF-kappa-B essential modulator n=1 Tax=Scleropages formosus TaxID=113540 RepID=A0A8C9RNQ1_SCLFO|nr:NF-kappa-B essential modulator-like isoform X2 [Scleropages formosus]